MAVSFPSNPTIGEIFTYQGISWEWNGTFWQTYTFPSSGLTGSTSVGVGDSLISGIVDNVLELKSLSGDGITITDDGDTILLVSDSSGNYLPLSGGTVTGVTTFNEIVYVNNNIYVDDVYATNYYGLPSFPNTYVTGFSLSNDVITLTQNSNDVYSSFTISLSAYTGNTSGEYLPISGGTVTGGTNFTSGLTANTISATTYQNLPVSGITEGTNIGVTSANGNFTISFTGTVGSDFTGGTVTGATNFTSGLTANTISATTYNNLPVSGITGGSNIGVNNTNGNVTISFTGTTGSNFTGGTVSGATNFTAGLTANTISATTYQNLPVSGITNGTGITSTTSNGVVTITNTSPNQIVTISGGTGITTGGTYPNFTITNSAPNQTITITGGTNIQINGSYPNFGIDFTGQTSFPYLPLSGGTITGNVIFQSGLTANTISATTYQNLPSQSGTGVNALSYSQTTGRLTLTKNDATTLTAGTFTYLTGISYSNNVITSTNNLGSSSTLTINSVTGLTVNGNLSVTGTTSSGTISATTYQNLPLRVSGTGTQDYVTKWNSTGNGISNSQIYDTGGFIGIATTTQSYDEKMSIYTNNKGIRVDSLYINQTSNGSLSFAIGGYGSWGTGGLEIAIGDKGPLANSVGNNNIAMGRMALGSNTTGSRNIAIGGEGVLSMNDSGSRNIAIGYFAMENNYNGSINIGIGDLSLQQNTNGSNNTAVGYASMTNNTDGTWNVAFGVGALNANNSGSFNTMIGVAAGNSSLTDMNTMIGSNAGTNTTSGDENTIIGSSSFISNTTGRGNTAIGTYSLYSTDGGDGNVSIGHNAGFSNITGGYNVIIGTEAASNNDGSNNIFIGYNVANADTASSNKLNIGDTIFGDLSSKLIGVNQPSPVTTLDVSGTTRITGGLTANTLSATSVTLGGNITMSNRPAFSVFGSGTTSNLTTTQNGTGTLNTNNFGLSYSQGTGFDISTGIFTAPIAGLYQVTLVGRNSGYASGISQLTVLKNNSNANGNVLMIEWASSSSMNHTGGSQIFKLAVGDTLRVRILAGQVNFDGNDNWSVAYIG